MNLLDRSRWVSTLAVLVCHTGNLMTAHLVDTPKPFRTIPFVGYVFLGGFGHQEVDIFYVLSWFLVYGIFGLEWKQRAPAAQAASQERHPSLGQEPDATPAV